MNQSAGAGAGAAENAPSLAAYFSYLCSPTGLRRALRKALRDPIPPGIPMTKHLTCFRLGMLGAFLLLPVISVAAQAMSKRY